MLALMKSCLPRAHLMGSPESIATGLRFASVNTGIAAGIRKGRWNRGAVKREQLKYMKLRKGTDSFNFGRGRVNKKGPELGTLDDWQLKFASIIKREENKVKSKIRHELEDRAIYDRSVKVSMVPPPQIPYNTVASEFIYGSAAVLSAARCARRKLHTLYVYTDDQYDFHTGQWGSTEAKAAKQYASLAGAVVKYTSGAWRPMLDKMSGGRPHNNIILEASPLPKLPVLSLGHVNFQDDTHFSVDLASQAAEQAADNGTNNNIPFFSQRFHDDPHTGREIRDHIPRYPFILLLDGVLDPGNVGAIIRSAYFFGADAIAFSARNSAPITPVALKAAAGAAEIMPLLIVQDTSRFVSESKANGWKFFAADTPESISNMQTNAPGANTPVRAPHELSSEASAQPCVLVVGGEERGISPAIKRKVNTFVSIPGAFSQRLSNDPAAVDSLNVSVASAVLTNAFLAQHSLGAPSAKQKSDLSEDKEDSRIF